MSTITADTFVFNKDYDDLAQVAHLYDAYMRRYTELVDAGKYPYNDSFKGAIGGLMADDKNEDTAIYLLQVTRHVREYEAKVQALYGAGYVDAPTTPGNITRHAHVAIVDMRYGQYGEVRHLESARTVHDDTGRVGYVLPKGARNRGYRVDHGAYVLVKG